MPGRTVTTDQTGNQSLPHATRKIYHRRSWSKYVLGLLSRSRETSPNPSTMQPTTEIESASVSEASTVGVEEMALASRILTIINRYKLPARDGQLEKPNTNFLNQVASRISRSEPILMCLPAFPFKSPNTSSKVLGTLPDKAEDFALAHLNGLCAAISHIYQHGARLCIVSDGLVYNGACS